MEQMARTFVGFVFFGFLIRETRAATTTRAHIGGMFAPYSPSGAQDLAQAEHLAAFVMAINEINNHSDGIYDDVLISYKVRFDIETSVSLDMATSGFIDMQSAFHRKGVSGYVSALGNEESLLIAQLAGVAGVTTMLSVANSGVFNEHRQYPYVMRTVASQSREGLVLQSFVCEYARKIVVYVSTSDEDIQLLYEFESSPACPLEYLGQYLVPGDQIDMSSFAALALETGARYFVLFLPPFQTAALLESGYELGVFGDNTVILTSYRGIQNISTFFTADADVPNLMTGLFTFNYWPNYYVNRTDEARAFAKRWKAQESTAGVIKNGTLVCNNGTDSQHHYLYQTVGMEDNITYCTGLNFAKYDDLGKKIQPYTWLTYDATIMMLLAIDLGMKAGITAPNADQMTDYLLNNISGINGTSGPIELYAGLAATGFDRRGNRVSGTEYVVYNFDSHRYGLGISLEDSLVPVGYFDADSRTLTQCSPINFVTCFSAEYRSATDGSAYNPPPDSPYPIQATMPKSYLIVFTLLFFAVIIEVLVLAGVVCWYRHTKVMKASQPLLLLCILVGGFIAALRIATGSSGPKTTDATCVTEVWLGHMSFVFIVGALMVKAYRVHCIVNTKKLRKVTFKENDAFQLLLGIILLTGVYLIFVTVFGVPVLRHVSQTIRNQETVWKYCTLVKPQWQTALYFMETGLLIFGFRTCWEIRNVPDLVNESKQISTAMSTIVFVCVLILPIVYFLGLPVYTREFVACLGFGLAAISTLSFIFIPKVYLIYCNTTGPTRGGARILAVDNEGVMVSSSNAAAASNAMAGTSASSRRKYNNIFTAALAGTSTSTTMTAETNSAFHARFAREMLHRKQRDERLMIVQEQIMGWQSILMNEQRHALVLSGDDDDNTGDQDDASVVKNNNDSYSSNNHNNNVVDITGHGGDYNNNNNHVVDIIDHDISTHKTNANGANVSGRLGSGRLGYESPALQLIGLGAAVASGSGSSHGTRNNGIHEVGNVFIPAPDGGDHDTLSRTSMSEPLWHSRSTNSRSLSHAMSSSDKEKTVDGNNNKKGVVIGEISSHDSLFEYQYLDGSGGSGGGGGGSQRLGININLYTNQQQPTIAEGPRDFINSISEEEL